jgi:hypothetical protein
MQNRYSFAECEPDFIVDYCTENATAFMPWAPLGQGRKAEAALEKVAQRTRCHSSANSFALAAQNDQDNSSDPRNFVGHASGRKCCGGRPRVAQGCVTISLPSAIQRQARASSKANSKGES